MNHISISKKQSDISDDKESDAFKEYVIGNAGIGIILSLDVINLKDSSRTKLMDGEIQIKDLIPLKYMLGIFFGGKSNNELLKDIKRAETPGISKSEIKELLPHTLTPNQNEIYNKIQELLCKYGYNAPIYSSRDGFQSSDIENILEVPELSD